jgi:hypothetical protein
VGNEPVGRVDLWGLKLCPDECDRLRKIRDRINKRLSDENKIISDSAINKN